MSATGQPRRLSDLGMSASPRLRTIAATQLKDASGQTRHCLTDSRRPIECRSNGVSIPDTPTPPG